MQSHSDRVRFLCQSALIAALYTALTFAVPVLSFGMMQLRISEAMTVLPILLIALIKMMSPEFAANFVTPVGLIATTVAIVMFVAAYFVGKKILAIKI